MANFIDVVRHYAHPCRPLRLDEREAAAIDRVRVTGRQHDVARVALERDPQGAARDAQRRPAGAVQADELAGG